MIINYDWGGRARKGMYFTLCPVLTDVNLFYSWPCNQWDCKQGTSDLFRNWNPVQALGKRPRLGFLPLCCKFYRPSTCCLKQQPREIKLLTSTLLPAAAHVTDPLGICSSSLLCCGSLSPALSHKFPQSLDKEGQSECICPLSGMSRKSNSCWPAILFVSKAAWMNSS